MNASMSMMRCRHVDASRQNGNGDRSRRDGLLERDGGDGGGSVASRASASPPVSSGRLCVSERTTGKDDDEDDDDGGEDDEEDEGEDEGEAWTVEMGPADDGGVARGGDEARGERRRRARGERRMRARGVRIGDGDDRDRGRVRGAIGATEIGG